MDANFEVLKGKTLSRIEGMEKGNDVVTFYCTDGSAYEMFHSQDCCECVEIEDVCGDVEDLIGSEILVAEENIHENENPEGVEVPEYQDSFTWTFYKLATRKGYVDLRWYGESNGYYSESVDFKQIAFAPVKIFASIIDDATRQQVKELSESEAYKDCMIRVMPDCHAGMGCTIGSVIKFKDRVVPNTVGVDIGCGMLVVELGNVDIDLEKLDRVVNEHIPAGFNIHEQPAADYDFGFMAPLKDKDYLHRSIGTLGGGNHFIELDADEDGNKYLVIHSGSRNLGVQVCKYWQNQAVENLTDDSNVRKEIIENLKAQGREKEIGEALKQIKKPKINKDLAYIEGGALQCYLHDMKKCQEYAMLNREIMAKIILKHIGFKGVVREFTTIHNYIDTNECVIRKGAIKAGRRDKVLIPLNMRDGSLICEGKGNEDWLCSAPHGAGRIMSRAQAFKEVQMDDFQKSMEGIYTTSVCEETLDEAPQVYKSADIIRKDIEPTVEILKVIKPLWNFKAKESEHGKARKEENK